MSVMNRMFINRISRRAFATLSNLKQPNFEDDCLRSTIPDVQIPNAHVVEYIMKDFGLWHDKIALECGFTGRKYTYDEVRIKAINLNKSLRKKLKLQKNDVVALVLPNIPEFPICVYGVLLAGLKITTINPAYTGEEIKRQLEDANVKAVIAIGSLWNNITGALKYMRKNIPIIVIKDKADEVLPEGAINFKEFADEECDIGTASLANPQDTIFLPYSSGTTGHPKGVELTSHNLLANVKQLGSPEVCISTFPTETQRDCLPAILPMFHIYGFTATVLYSMMMGTKLITLSKFTPESYLQTLIKHKPNVLMLVPPIVIFLYAHPAVKTEYFKHLNYAFCGAAPLGPLDEDKFRQKVNRPIHILQGYGLSEASPVVSVVPKGLQGKLQGSIGHPLANTSIKIVDINDSEGNNLGPNKTGELLVKGPQVMKGYLNKPEETRNSFLNGWLRTGDLAYYNDEGLLFIADRIKELIKVNAFQVPPAELEDMIRDYPGIADAAVIGIPHPIHGEVPRAYIVSKPGTEIDTSSLMDYVEKKVARHKRLRGGVAVVDSIPKNASGKILRRQIKQMYEEKGI